MKKIQKWVAVLAGASAILAVLCGFSLNTPAVLVNTQELSADGVERISISYISETITFLESSTDKIVLKEYMRDDEQRFHAKISQKKGSLSIQAGERPKYGNFQSYVEIYLPDSYHNILDVASVSGDILSDQSMSLTELNAATVSGSVVFQDIAAGSVNLGTVSGSVQCGKVSGQTNAGTMSGGIKISELAGFGDFHTTSGNISVNFTSVTGDVGADSTSGDIEITVPRKLNFQYSAKSSSGNITTSFDGQTTRAKKTVSGTVGKDAVVSVSLHATSGGIVIRQPK